MSSPDLEWHTGVEKGYKRIAWLLHNRSKDDPNPYKVLMNVDSHIGAGGIHQVWNEQQNEWRNADIPQGLSVDETKAMLILEYRLHNAG